jgi:hypothetical protein
MASTFRQPSAPVVPTEAELRNLAKNDWVLAEVRALSVAFGREPDRATNAPSPVFVPLLKVT